MSSNRQYGSEPKSYTESKYVPDSNAEESVDGPVSEPSGVNASLEDKEAAESERTGRIPKREVEELRGAGDEVLSGRTRGVKNDAYKAERDLDKALVQEGTYDEGEI